LDSLTAISGETPRFSFTSSDSVVRVTRGRRPTFSAAAIARAWRRPGQSNRTSPPLSLRPADGEACFSEGPQDHRPDPIELVPQTFVPNIFWAKAGDYRKAVQRVYHKAGHANFIELPLVRMQ